MNTLSPIKAFPLARQRLAALTILEMLVSTAMLAFIVLGLTAMLITTQKAFKSGIKQNTVSDAGHSVLDMMASDLLLMGDAANTNTHGAGNPYQYNPNFNFYWSIPVTGITNYLNGVAIRTNELDTVFILQHTNTTWIGVGYAVSNVPGVDAGTLYRYETNWTALAPVFTNDLFSAFLRSLATSSFTSNYWHKVADGVIDLRVTPYDQNGNENEYNYTSYASLGRLGPQSGSYSAYPIYPWIESTNSYTNTLPYAVELELAILEPATLSQARAFAAIPTALTTFLSSNAAPNMEVFRQRITINAAIR